MSAPRIDLGELERTSPISAHWGFDRGKPIDRYYIEAFLDEHASNVRGAVLEFGDDAYARWFGRDRLAETAVLDVDPSNASAAYHQDLAVGGGLPRDAFDCVICTQTLQLVYDIGGAVGALARVLKPGGVVLATVPGITRISTTEWPGSWFWSLTSASALRLFAEHFGASNVSVRAYGNVLAATAFLHGLAVEDVETAALEVNDPEFEVIVAIRAARSSPSSTPG
jgi:SAM-dependent methyltransferase